MDQASYETLIPSRIRSFSPQEGIGAIEIQGKKPELDQLYYIQDLGGPWVITKVVGGSQGYFANVEQELMTYLVEFEMPSEDQLEEDENQELRVLWRISEQMDLLIAMTHFLITDNKQGYLSWKQESSSEPSSMNDGNPSIWETNE
jgi:hypothetical protein